MKSLITIAASICISIFSSHALASALQCGDLTGKIYAGLEGQGGSSQPGCEGCGNDGEIEFIEGNSANVVWVGSDIQERCTYVPDANPLILTCQFGSEFVLELSDDCRTLSAKGAVFVLRDFCFR